MIWNTYGGGMPGGTPKGGGTTGGGTDISGAKLFFLLYSLRSAVITWNSHASVYIYIWSWHFTLWKLRCLYLNRIFFWKISRTSRISSTNHINGTRSHIHIVQSRHHVRRWNADVWYDTDVAGWLGHGNQPTSRLVDPHSFLTFAIGPPCILVKTVIKIICITLKSSVVSILQINLSKGYSEFKNCIGLQAGVILTTHNFHEISSK